jgi:hypothetical protein
MPTMNIIRKPSARSTRFSTLLGLCTLADFEFLGWDYSQEDVFAAVDYVEVALARAGHVGFDFGFV